MAIRPQVGVLKFTAERDQERHVLTFCKLKNYTSVGVVIINTMWYTEGTQLLC